MMEDLPMVLLANVVLIHTNLIKNTKEHERDHRPAGTCFYLNFVSEKS